MDLISNILSYAIPLIAALGILVFIHELGHFLAARLFGMRVDVFSIGFPPRIFGKKIGQTEYRIGALPLGGYVKIAGMIDESMDTEFEGQPPQPDEFRSKPVWQRMVVITAGVFFNLVLAWAIFVGLKWAYGESYIPAENIQAVYVADSTIAAEMGMQTGDRIVAINGKPLERFDDLSSPAVFAQDPLRLTVERDGQDVVLTGPQQLLSRMSRASQEEGSTGLGITFFPSLLGGVAGDSAAEEAGLAPGDRIVAIDGQPIQFWEEVSGAVQQDKPLSVRVLRARDAAADTTLLRPVQITDAGVIYETTVTPRYDEAAGRYLLGILGPNSAQLQEAFGIAYAHLGFGEAVVAGTQEAGRWVGLYVNFVGRLFTGKESVKDSVGGPLMIAQATKEAAQQGLQSFWLIVAMLSIALAVFNILPIPALDGGHLVFLLYEGITRREPSVKVRMAFQQVGFFLLLAFMAFVIFNDATRFW